MQQGLKYAVSAKVCSKFLSMRGRSIVAVTDECSPFPRRSQLVSVSSSSFLLVFSSFLFTSPSPSFSSSLPSFNSLFFFLFPLSYIFFPLPLSLCFPRFSCRSLPPPFPFFFLPPPFPFFFVFSSFFFFHCSLPAARRLKKRIIPTLSHTLSLTHSRLVLSHTYSLSPTLSLIHSLSHAYSRSHPRTLVQGVACEKKKEIRQFDIDTGELSSIQVADRLWDIIGESHRE